MSAQRLGPRKIRGLEHLVGEPIKMAWVAYPRPWFAFVTPDHRHGLVNRTTGEFTWDDPDDRDQHYTSCYDGTLFNGPGDTA